MRAAHFSPIKRVAIPEIQTSQLKWDLRSTEGKEWGGVLGGIQSVAYRLAILSPRSLQRNLTHGNQSSADWYICQARFKSHVHILVQKWFIWDSGEPLRIPQTVQAVLM